MDLTVTIAGMTCAHCDRSVEASLALLPAVTRVVAHHATGTAQVEASGPLDADDVREALDEAGFDLVGIAALG